MDVKNGDEVEYESAYGILCSVLPKTASRQGLVPTFCRVPAGAATLRHSHFEPEIYFVLEGHGHVEAGRTKSPVKAGDLIRLPPFTSHQLVNEGAEDLRFLSVYSEDFEVPTLPSSAFVTAAPPTPNGPLHLGHISGPYLGSDVLARYLRLRSVPVVCHSGTDDHQNYVQERARTLKQRPEDFRKEMRGRITAGLEALDIGFDEFIEPRSDDIYRARVQTFFQLAQEAGVIREEKLDWPYCEPCDLYLVDALAAGRCPSCGQESHGACEACGWVSLPSDLHTVHCGRCARPSSPRRARAHVFNLSTSLSRIEPEIERWDLTARIRNLVAQAQSSAGVKVLVSSPAGEGVLWADDGRTIHVWMEMAAHYAHLGHDVANRGSTWIHCFGFDNAFYYLLFIPALLRALDPHARLPDFVVTNEFLHLEGAKFSTSRGHAIWADEFNGNTDHLRLFLCLHRPSRRIADFSSSDFERFSRELEFQLTEVRERARTARHDGTPASRSALVACNRATKEMEAFLAPSCPDLRAAARHVLAHLDATLHADESIRLMSLTLATLLVPIMPREARTLLDALGCPEARWQTDWTANP